MELKRRQFVALLLAGAAAMAAGAAGLWRRVRYHKVTRAARPAGPPAGARPLDEAAVRQRGPWAG